VKYKNKREEEKKKTERRIEMDEPLLGCIRHC